MRDAPFFIVLFFKLFLLIFAREAAEGAKAYVWASLAGKTQDRNVLRENMHGAFTMDCEIAEPSDYVLSREGRDAEKKLWVKIFGIAFPEI
jgi:retinol dehydrogenase-12